MLKLGSKRAQTAVEGGASVEGAQMQAPVKQGHIVQQMDYARV